jgi:tetratricopeptide (TPR) repeat protein
MYRAKTVETVFPDGQSKKYTYLLCDSLEEFREDTAGVVGAACVWDAQTGKLTRAEAREKAKEEPHHLKWEKNPHLALPVKSAMEEAGAVISATVSQDLYGMGREKGMRELRELIINKKIGDDFFIAKAFIPGYESIFDGTINKPSSKIIEMSPDYASAFLDIAEACEVNFDYDQAIENYSQAIKIDPNYAVAYFKRGGINFKKGDNDSAVNDLSRFINLQPDVAVAYFNRGFVYMKQEDYDNAIADYTKAIGLNPENRDVYELRGTAYSKKGDTEKVDADFAAAKELNKKTGRKRRLHNGED